MKADSRHLKRIRFVQELYASSFQLTKQKISKKTLLIQACKPEIITYIEKYSSRYATEKISKIDYAILMLSIYDLVVEKKVPPKVIINEAVELAKELSGPRSSAFINAVLGKVYEAFQKNNIIINSQIVKPEYKT